MYIHDFWVELLPMFTDFQIVYLFLDVATFISLFFVVIVGPFWIMFGSRGDKF